MLTLRYSNKMSMNNTANIRKLFKQSQEFATEALNAHQRTLRMRGRPKIVFARTYQEAMDIYGKYQNNILGVITDVRFPKVERGEKDGLAGIKLMRCHS